MATSKKPNTVEIVTALSKPIVENMGLTLWDVRFEKEGSSWYLRIFIDKEEGVTIQDCEDVSRKLDPIIDEADPITEAYYFEVSSPGIGRDLVRPWHFQLFLEKDVEVRMIRPVEGTRDFRGTLMQADDDSITIKSGENLLTIIKKETSYIRLYEEL